MDLNADALGFILVCVDHIQRLLTVTGMVAEISVDPVIALFVDVGIDGNTPFKLAAVVGKHIQVGADSPFDIQMVHQGDGAFPGGVVYPAGGFCANMEMAVNDFDTHGYVPLSLCVKLLHFKGVAGDLSGFLPGDEP